METTGIRFHALMQEFMNEHAAAEWNTLPAKARERLKNVGAKFEAIIEPSKDGSRFWGFEILGCGPQEISFGRISAEFNAPPGNRLLRATLLLSQLETIVLFRNRTSDMLGAEHIRFTVNLDSELFEPDDTLLRAILRRYADRLSGSTYFELSEKMPATYVDRIVSVLLAFRFAAILDDVKPETPPAFLQRNLLRRVFATKVDATDAKAAIRSASDDDRALDKLLQLVPAGLRLIIEGVEGADQSDYLRHNWPERAPPVYWQGYTVHPPSPWSDFLVSLAPNHPCGYALPKAKKPRKKLKQSLRDRAPADAAVVNGYKLFYYRVVRHFSHTELARAAEVDINVIHNLEHVTRRPAPECFGKLSRRDLGSVERVLNCVGKLEWGQHDDLLARYLMFYTVNHNALASRVTGGANKLIDFVPHTKAVVFDFGGTLTLPSGPYSTWERMWLLKGYSTRDAGDLLKLFRAGKIDHQTWCDRTKDRLREKGFSKSDLDAIIADIRPIPGLHEALQALDEAGIALYVVSGSLRQIIEPVLGHAANLPKTIMSNQMMFDDAGIISEIRGHEFDFEGKAQFIRNIVSATNCSPFDILFVGNSLNDSWACESGARTLCVNPSDVDFTNTDIWSDHIRQMDDLREILQHAGLKTFANAVTSNGA